MSLRPLTLVLFLAGLAGVLGLATWARGGGPEDQRPKRDEVHQTIFFAVLEGLYRDGASNAFVDRVLEKDAATRHYRHFVYGCPLCDPALDAFLLYRSRPKFVASKDEADHFGHGVSATWKKKLSADTQQARINGLMDLVKSYTKRHLDRRRLTDEERAWWSRSLKERAKKGTAILRAMQSSGQAGAFGDAKFCGVCEGASNWLEE